MCLIKGIRNPRWTSPRYPDSRKTEDVSDERDVEPQQCAYHDVISLSSACTALALSCLLVYPKVRFHLTKLRGVHSIRTALSGCLL
jgi:hypothetical protein